MENTVEMETLDTYIRKVENQEIKGILLKLKNEMRKPDVTWESVKTILVSVEQKNPIILKEIFSLLIKEPE
jgi:hypothetical protein